MSIYIVCVITTLSVFDLSANQSAWTEESQASLGTLLWYETSLSLEARRFEEVSIDKATLIGPHLNLDGEFYLKKEQSFLFRLELVQEFGSSQTRFGENVPSNDFFIKDAYYSRKSSDLLFDLGVIGQSWLNNELLFADQPFPALRLRYFLNQEEGLQSDIFFQVAMPATTKIKERVSENEDEPYSIILGAGLDLDNEGWLISSKFYYYHLDSLPSEIALESAKFGNTVTTISSTQASFDEDFQGFSFTLNLEKKFQEVSLLLDAYLLHNFSVSDGFGDGQMYYLGTKYPFSGDEQSVYVIYFFNESDTSVASYNSYRIGHNNRDGYGFRLRHDFNESVYFDFTYLKSEPINAVFLQEEIIYINSSVNWKF